LEKFVTVLLISSNGGSQGLTAALQVIVLGSVAQIIAFSIQASAPPFPLFAIAYAINGFGESLEDAQANGFVATYKDNAATKMGILHAAYGRVFIQHRVFSNLLAVGFRCRSVGISSRSDAVCAAKEMVVSLPHFPRDRNAEHNFPYLRLQVSDSGW
jgi:hypothetical protein